MCIFGALLSPENNFMGNFSYQHPHINKSMKLFIPLTRAKTPLFEQMNNCSLLESGMNKTLVASFSCAVI